MTGSHFKGKIAIVTGGASGIGRALCEELGRRGAVVIAADINLDGLEKVTEAISVSGGRATPAFLDVSQAGAVEKLIDGTTEKYGRLDYMFNNAGIAVLGEIRYQTPEQWKRIIDINLLGAISGTTRAYSVMVRQGFGHIVNTASQAGLYLVPGSTAYGTTKHAVVGLSTALRAEGAALGVKVSVVCPGPVNTAIFDSATVVLQDKEDVPSDQRESNGVDFFGQMPKSMMTSVDKAAMIILEGVIRNQAIIIFPFLARFLWWLHRINPGILDLFGRQMFKVMRKFAENKLFGGKDNEQV